MRYRTVALAAMACLAIGIAASGADKPALKGGKAKFTEKEISAIQKELEKIPAKYYYVEIERDGRTVKMGSAQIKNLKSVHVYSPGFADAKTVNEIFTTIGNHIRVIVTGDIAEDVRDRVTKVNQLLEAKVQQ